MFSLVSWISSALEGTDQGRDTMDHHVADEYVEVDPLQNFENSSNPRSYGEAESSHVNHTYHLPPGLLKNSGSIRDAVFLSRIPQASSEVETKPREADGLEDRANPSSSELPNECFSEGSCVLKADSTEASMKNHDSVNILLRARCEYLMNEGEISGVLTLTKDYLSFEPSFEGNLVKVLGIGACQMCVQLRQSHILRCFVSPINKMLPDCGENRILSLRFSSNLSVGQQLFNERLAKTTSPHSPGEIDRNFSRSKSLYHFPYLDNLNLNLNSLASFIHALPRKSLPLPSVCEKNKDEAEKSAGRDSDFNPIFQEKIKDCVPARAHSIAATSPSGLHTDISIRRQMPPPDLDWDVVHNSVLSLSSTKHLKREKPHFSGWKDMDYIMDEPTKNFKAYVFKLETEVQAYNFAELLSELFNREGFSSKNSSVEDLAHPDEGYWEVDKKMGLRDLHSLSREALSPELCSAIEGVSIYPIPFYRLEDEDLVIMSESHMLQIQQHLPPTVAICQWLMAFNPRIHGISYSTFYEKVEHKGPVLIVLKDTNDVLFGFFTSEIKRSPKYYGTAETFVFSFKSGDIADTKKFSQSTIQAFPWSQKNSYFVYSDSHYLAAGGGGHYAISIDSYFSCGCSDECPTFDSPLLSSTKDFILRDFQAWIFSDF